MDDRVPAVGKNEQDIIAVLAGGHCGSSNSVENVPGRNFSTELALEAVPTLLIVYSVPAEVLPSLGEDEVAGRHQQILSELTCDCTSKAGGRPKPPSNGTWGSGHRRPPSSPDGAVAWSDPEGRIG